MKKKILLSMILISAVIGGTFLVTRAFFTDTETSAGNQFTVGTLDLDVGGANGTNVEPFVVTNIGQEGDIAGSKTWTVNNTGSLPGRLYFRLEDVVNQELGCNEPEAIVDTTCANPGPQEGELGNKIVANVYLDNNLVHSGNLTATSQADYTSAWTALPSVVIPAGGNVQVKMDWSADQADYGNEIQGDSLSFNVGFDLQQITN